MRSETVTRILKKAGILSPGAHGFDSYFVMNGKLFGKNISCHPWKNREYSAHKLCPVSPEEKDLFERLSESDRQEELSSRQDSLDRAAVREEWIQSLPNKIAGFCVNKSHGTLEDQHGNYYLTLPSPRSLVELKTWIAENSYDPE